jgi:hypothetical protein
VGRQGRIAYWLDKRCYISRERRRSGDPIVVLTLGKTGSSTVAQTLRERIPDRPVYQVHRIAPDTLAAAEREYRATAPEARPEHVFAGYYLRTRMPTRERRWDVISLVRDPVVRGVSAYFQTGVRLGHALDDLEAARAQLLRWPAFSIANTWFDKEIRGELGVDVFDHPFDPMLGYGCIDTPTVRLLLIRQENLGQAANALAAFLNAPITALSSTNVSGDKDYAEAYRRFRSEVALPSTVLDEMYESRFARHFYTDAERARFRAEWEG